MTISASILLPEGFPNASAHEILDGGDQAAALLEAAAAQRASDIQVDVRDGASVCLRIDGRIGPPFPLSEDEAKRFASVSSDPRFHAAFTLAGGVSHLRIQGSKLEGGGWFLIHRLIYSRASAF